MRYLLTTLLLVSLISLIAQTTETEFNYVTKGYKIELESGLDSKKGYEMIDLNEFLVYSYGRTQRRVIVKQLYRIGDINPCATLMILERTDTTYEEYLCIPHFDSEEGIWYKARERFNQATREWTETSKQYVWGMVMTISQISS